MTRKLYVLFAVPPVAAVGIISRSFDRMATTGLGVLIGCALVEIINWCIGSEEE